MSQYVDYMERALAGEGLEDPQEVAKNLDKEARRKLRKEGVRPARINDKARGFNNAFAWKNLADVESIDPEENKLGFMVVNHMKGCGACESLAEEFNDVNYIDTAKELFKNLHLVNVYSDEELPEGWNLEDEKMYYPRILFLSPDKKRLPIVNGNSSDEYPLFYTSLQSLMDSARKAILHIAVGGDMELVEKKMEARKAELDDDDYDDDAIEEMAEAAKKSKDAEKKDSKEESKDEL